MPDGPSHTELVTEDPPASSRLWRVVRGVGFTLLGLVSVIVGVLVLAVVLLQTPWGTNQARQLIEKQVSGLMNEATLTIDRLDGNFITGVRGYGLRIEQHGESIVEVDTARVKYELLPLLNRTVHLEEIVLDDPRVLLRRNADSTWNLATLFASDPAVEDTTASNWTVRIDELTLRDGAGRIVPMAAAPDSALRATGLNARVESFVVGPDGFQVRIDSLWGDLIYPNRMDSLHLAAAGTYNEAVLAVDTLLVTSPESRIVGNGIVDLGSLAQQTTDFNLKVQPLAFRDLKPFVPQLDEDGSLSGLLRLTTVGDSLKVRSALQATDGMTLNLDAVLIPAPGQSVTYRADGELRGLNPAYVLGDSTLAGRFNANLTLDATGPAVDSLDGTARLRVFDSVWNDTPIEQATLDARLAGSRTDVTLDLEAFGAAAQAQGVVRPFDEVLAYDLNGRFQDVRPENFVTLDGQNGVFNGTFTVKGQGTDPQAATANAQLNLEASRWNQAEIPDARIQASLRDGRLSSNGLVNLYQRGRGLPLSGTLALDAGARFGSETLTYDVENLAFEHLDLGALLADTTMTSDVSGTLTLNGQGSAPETMNLQATLRLDASQYGTYQVDSARVDAQFQQEEVTFDARAALGGTVELTGSAQPLAEVPTFSAQGRFDHIDIQRFLADTTMTSDLSGELILNGRGGSAESLTGEVQITLEPSTFNEESIQNGFVYANLDPNDLDFRTDLQFPEGRVQLSGTGTPFAEQPQFTISQGSLRGVDLGALLGNPSLATDLNGQFEAEIDGTDVGTMTLTSRVDVAASEVNREQIQGGQVTANLTDGQFRMEADLELGSGSARLAAQGRFVDEVPTYEVLGRLANVDLAALAGFGADTMETDLSLAFSVSGRGTDPNTMTLTGLVTGGTSYLAQARIDSVLMQVNVEDGWVEVDTLMLRSNVASLAGAGAVALPGSNGATGRASAFTFDARIRSLQPLAPLLNIETLEGEGTISGRVYGTPERLRFEVTPGIEYVIYEEYRLAGINGFITGEYADSLRLETDLELGYFATPSISIQRTTLDLAYSPERVLFETEITVDQRRDIALQGQVDLIENVRRFSVENLNLRFDEDRWQLLQEAAFDVEGPRYQVRNFLLYSGSQQIALDGIVNLEGEQNLVFTTEGLRSGAVADLLGYGGLEGELNTFLVLSGPASAPQIDGGFRLDDITSNDRPVGALRTEVQYDGSQMNLVALLRSPDGNTLTAEGFIPVNLSLTGVGEVREDAPVEFVVQADSFAIGWARPFLDPDLITDIGGLLTTDIVVGGTQNAPQLSGTASLRQGTLRLVSTNQPYQDIQIDATLTDRLITLNEAVMHSDRGRMEATGAIKFETLTTQLFDLAIQAEGFRAISTETYQATLGGEFTLGGGSEAPVLNGAVTLGPMDVFLTDELTATELETVQLTDRDLQILEARFGYRITADDTTTFDFYQAMKMDLDVTMGSDVWVRSAKNPTMDIEFDGTLEVQKEHYGELDVFGTIEVNPRRSVIRQYGRRFNLESGELRFNGPIEETVMNLRAAFEVPARQGEQGPTIYLDVTGRFEEPQVELSSDPQLETIDILSYIATGRPAGEGLFGNGASGAGGIEATAAGLAIGQFTSILEGVAGEGLGLDVISIENDGLRGATLIIGKYLRPFEIGNYVSPQIYASLSQPINISGSAETSTLSGGQEIAVEVELFKWMLARLTSRNRSLQFNLLFEYAY